MDASTIGIVLIALASIGIGILALVAHGHSTKLHALELQIVTFETALKSAIPGGELSDLAGILISLQQKAITSSGPSQQTENTPVTHN